MKRFLLVILIAAVAALAAYFIARQHSAAVPSTIANLLPADTALFIHIPDVEKNRDDWQKAVRDLDVAVLHAPEEAKDHKVFRGWGRGEYHPHVGLVEYLLKFHDCSEAWRELPRVHRDRHDEVAKRIGDQCREVVPLRHLRKTVDAAHRQASTHARTSTARSNAA